MKRTNYMILAIILSVIPLVIFAVTYNEIDYEIVYINTGMMNCQENDNCYEPSLVTVEKGDKVIWINQDMHMHTVTSSNATDNFELSSDTLRKGESYSHTFEKSGSYPYYCVLHDWMIGSVIVT